MRWIRQSILQAIAEKSNMIRLPLNKVGEMHKRAKFIAQKLQSDEREPTAEETAEVLGISV